MRKSWARGLVALVLAGCGGATSDFGAMSEALTAPEAIASSPQERLAAPVITLAPLDRWKLALDRHDDGEFATAAKMFDALISTYPIARSLAARSLMEEGRLEDAYREAVLATREFEHPISYFVLGLVAFRDGRLDEAKEAYLHALDLEPNHVASLNNLGGIYYHFENFSEARYQTEKALEFAQDSLDQSIAESNLAELDALRGDLRSAEERLDRALELTPDEAHPYFGLAVIYDLTGREDAAIKMAESGLELDYLGRTRRAISFVWPELELHHDAILAEGRGDSDKARELWEELRTIELKRGVKLASLKGRAAAHLQKLEAVERAQPVERQFVFDRVIAPVEGPNVDIIF